MQQTTVPSDHQKTSPSMPVTNSTPQRPDPEVKEKKPRRRFTGQYKLKVLSEVDACSSAGEVGALLRREGLYSSNLTTWKRQREAGVLQALTPKKRGRKKQETSPLAKRVAELERDNKKLANRLKQAESIIEVQKKISEILGISQPNNADKSS